MPLVEFSYNYSYESTIRMAPYKTLYVRRCVIPHCWAKASDRIKLGPELIKETTKKVKRVQECLKTAYDRTISYVNKQRRDLDFKSRIKPS